MEEVKTNTIIIEVPKDIIKKYDGFSILNLNDNYEVPVRSKIPENYLEDEQFDYGQNYEDNDEQKDFNVQNNDEEDQNNQSNEEENDDDNQLEQEDPYSDCAAYFKKIKDKYYIVHNSRINPNNLNQIAISSFYYNINAGKNYWDNIILPITLKNFAENSDKVIYVNINQNPDDNNSLTTDVEFKEENDCQEIINQYDSADKTDETIGRENARKIANIIIEIENYNDLLIDNCYIYEINETNQLIARLKISFEKIDNKLIATATLAEPYMKLNKNNQIAIGLYNKNDLVAYRNIEFSPNPNLNEIPYIKFDNEFSCTSGYLEISCAEKIISDYENTTNQKNNSECLKVSDTLSFEKTANQESNKIKRNLAIAIGIVLAVGVAVVTALTFGWPLIPTLLITKFAIGLSLSLLISKIAIGLVAALAIATFIYVAIKSKEIKNNKYQNLGYEQISKDELTDNNDLGKNNQNQITAPENTIESQTQNQNPR